MDRPGQSGLDIARLIATRWAADPDSPAIEFYGSRHSARDLRALARQLQAAPGEAELRAFCLAHHVPVRFHIARELPRTPSFKINLGALKALLAN